MARKDDALITWVVLGDWEMQAACRGRNDIDWFPDLDEDESSDVAKAVCATCPVISQCQAYATESRQFWGVWGGTDEYDRGRVRPRRRRAAQSSANRTAVRLVVVRPTCPSCLSQAVVVQYDQSHLTCVVCRIVWPAPLR